MQIRERPASDEIRRTLRILKSDIMSRCLYWPGEEDMKAWLKRWRDRLDNFDLRDGVEGQATEPKTPP
jgi:hypothetical protein